MKTVFVDTSAWYAVANATDRNHGPASAFLAEMAGTYARMTTTNLVIGETYTLILSRAGRSVARKFLGAMRDSSHVNRVFVSEALERRAYDLIELHDTIPLSYVDATSFAVMNDLGITDCFAFDHHFAAGGFTLVPSV
ncbi:MAG: PIN domain-containing protein [Chloroflexi bacterium]|nr:PIN domain-containing protein [Chloroflexota bacterium]